MNILVSDISSYKAIVLCKYIKKNYRKMTIFSYDRRAFTRYFHTKYTDRNFILKSKENSKGLPLEKIAKLIRELNINIFFPVHSTYIDAILANRTLFGDSLNYVGLYESYRILNDKHKLDELASQLRINKPMRYMGLDNATVKCVVKPRISSPSEKVLYIHSEQALDALRKQVVELNKYIIQEYIQGTGVGYSVFAKDGQIITGYGHRRLAEYPVTGGASVYRESYKNDEMKSVAQKILKATNWSGFAMFEFKLTPDNDLYLLEVNPRIWGSLNQGLQNGANYLSPLLGDTQISKYIPAEEIKTFLSPALFLALTRYLARGQPDPLLNFVKNVFRNKSDISLIDDYRGWISAILRHTMGK